MKKMSIYEPAQRDGTGVYGFDADNDLIRISAALKALKQDGVEVERYNQGNAPKVFLNNPVINRHISEKGSEGLPAVILDEEIVIYGRYPTNKEIADLLEIPENYFNLAQKKSGSG